MEPVGGDGSLLRKINGVAALRALHGGDGATLRELAGLMGVSRNTAEEALRPLLEGGLAEEVPRDDEAARAVGRPARRYRLRPTGRSVVGVDLAVHEVIVVVSDLRGEERYRVSEAIEDDATPDRRIRLARSVIRRAVQESGVDPQQVMAVGAATTGIVSPEGEVLRSSRLPAMDGRRLATDLATLEGVPVIVGNDARVATLAEQWRGVATDVDSFVAILAGRRITAGIVLDRAILRGVHGAAGELGGMPESTWRDALAEMDAWDATREEVFAAAARGEPDALARADTVAAALARGVAVLVLTVDPECVVLGGGLAKAGAAILDPLQRHLDALTLFPVPVRLSTLDHDAVVTGAVRLALDAIETELFDVTSQEIARLYG